MSCAFIADTYDLAPLNTGVIVDAIQTTRDALHPMIGFSAELMHLIACLGRYCRTLLETSVRDPELEATLEEQLLGWDPNHEDQTLVDISVAYRNHSLIILYIICGFFSPNNEDMVMASRERYDPRYELHRSSLRSMFMCASWSWIYWKDCSGALSTRPPSTFTRRLYSLRPLN